MFGIDQQTLIGIALIVTAAWGLLDQNPLVVLSLPDQTSDAIFHCAVAAVFVLPLLIESIGDAVSNSAKHTIS